jgi:zinc transport system substrate-binding protein
MRYTISSIAASLIGSLIGSAAMAQVPSVVTDIPPVHSLAAMVLGDLGSPVLLLDQGADAHDFQLRPSQAQAVAGAGLVVWMGPEISPWLDRVIDGLGSDAPQLALLAVEGTALRSYDAADEEHGHDHAEAKDDHGHDHDHAEAKEGHDHGHDHDHAEAESGHDHGHGHDHDHSGTDPHAWLDPGNAALWVDALAAELGRLDPANAAAYAANAAAARDRIAAAEAAAAARLEGLLDRPVIVNHDAYGYFAGHFGLISVAHIAGGDAASPGAAALRDLIAAAQDKGAACVFPEANHDPGMAEQVAADTGARLGGALDPEGSGLTPGPDLYPALVTGLA